MKLLHGFTKGLGPWGGPVCARREFTDSALPFAVDRIVLGRTNGIAHRDAATTNFLNRISDGDRTGATDWLAEPGGQAVHDDINIFIAFGVEIVDA